MLSRYPLFLFNLSWTETGKLKFPTKNVILFCLFLYPMVFEFMDVYATLYTK